MHYLIFPPNSLPRLLLRSSMLLTLVSTAVIYGNTAATTPPAAAPEMPLYAAREKGRRAMSDGIYGTATRFFQEYRDSTARQQPAFADATILLVESLVHQQRIDDAVAALSYHQQHSGELEDATYREGLSYWHAYLQGYVGTKARTLALAATLARNATSRHYRHLALELAGNAAAELERWTDAEEFLSQRLRELPAQTNSLSISADIKLNLAKVFLATGRNDEAKVILADLEAAPGSISALTLRLYQIIVLILGENLDEALSHYEQIEAQRPQRRDRDWWLVASRLSMALVANQRHEEALTILPQAAALAPNEQDRIRSRLRAAECLITLGRVELAIDALETFKKDYPNVTEVVPVVLHLADLLRQTRSFLTAAEYYQTVAGNVDAPIDLRYGAAVNRAWCYHDNGNFSLAADAFAAAAELDVEPQAKAKALLLAGDACSHDENHTQAAAYYQRVSEQFVEVEALAERACYNQANSLSKAKLFAQAALVLEKFRQRYPESERREQVHLQLGVSLHKAGDHVRAVEELRQFATLYPQSSNAPRALLQGYRAAMASEDIATAIELLSTVVKSYSDSDFFAHALYQRAYVHFYQADFRNAIADSEAFLDKFPLLPLATDVLMWLGDYYANRGELLISEGHFLKLVSTHPRSNHAPFALYEAAKGAYNRNDLTRANLLLQQFAGDYAEAPPRIRAQAAVLQGDIYAENGNYQQALVYFRAAAELIPGTAVAGAARGRVGEMLYSLGTQSDDKEQLQRAQEVFAALTADADLPADIREMGRYRLGKTYEKLGQLDAAIEQYLAIVYEYDLDLHAGQVRDWYYFARSGYDAAALLLQQNQLHQAARTYERIAASGIPTGEDAREKARQIRRAQERPNGNR